MPITPIKPTSRGFLRAEFEDRYHNKCSIQESNLASEDAIWLGVDTTHDGREVLTRMHLTKDQVKALLPLLQFFAMTGGLNVPGVATAEPGPKPEGEEKHIICCGSLSEGYTFHGPYDSFDAACLADVDLSDSKSWIATLYPPRRGT